METGHFLQGMVFTGQDEEHDYYYDNGTFCSCAVKRIDGKREGPVTIQDRTGRVLLSWCTPMTPSMVIVLAILVTIN